MASVIEKTIRSAVTPVLGAVAGFNRVLGVFGFYEV